MEILSPDDQWFVDRFMFYMEGCMIPTDHIVLNAVTHLTDEQFETAVRGAESVVYQSVASDPESIDGVRHVVWSLYLKQLRELRETGTTDIRTNAWKD